MKSISNKRCGPFGFGSCFRIRFNKFKKSCYSKFFCFNSLVVQKVIERFINTEKWDCIDMKPANPKLGNAFVKIGLRTKLFQN